MGKNEHYFKQYLKYKNKYLNLKKGGARGSKEIGQSCTWRLVGSECENGTCKNGKCCIPDGEPTNDATKCCSSMIKDEKCAPQQKS
jgi:hypothetical protein